MLYSEIIMYRRNEPHTVEGQTPPRQHVDAYRVSTSYQYGHHTVTRLDIGTLYRGHCQWIADDIAARNNRNRNYRRAA